MSIRSGATRIRALRKLRRENPSETYVFVTERDGSMSTIGFHHLIQKGWQG